MPLSFGHEAAAIPPRQPEPSVKTAIALRHVHFEDLGTFDAVLTAAGYGVRYCDIGVHELRTLDALEPDLLLVLGGPVGVNDAQSYPFLRQELELLELRLRASRPTFGICLGAQLMAAALGAPVIPNGCKEIGFAPLTLTAAGKDGPLRHLAQAAVLHWHGDTFGIPTGAVHLAATAACAHQAFALGSNIMAVQFHPEIDACVALERWLIGHAAELAAAGIDPRDLRRQAQRHGIAVCNAGREMFAEWLAGVAP